MFAQGEHTTSQSVNFSGDSFQLIAVSAGSGIPNTTSAGIQFVGDVLSGNPEDTTIYDGTRPTISGVTWAYGTSGTVDWSFSNIVLAQQSGDDGNTRYFVIGDTSSGASDATHPVVAILDPDQLVTVVNGGVTIQAAAGGLIQFTGGG